MANLSAIVGQLKKERDRLQQQLSGLNAALAAFAGVYTTTEANQSLGGRRKRRTMSAKGRAAIRRAQKARWAKVRAAKQFRWALCPARNLAMYFHFPARLARCAA